MQTASWPEGSFLAAAWAQLGTMTSAALCALDSDSDEPFRSPLNGIIRSVPPRLNPELEKFVVCAADGHKMSPSTSGVPFLSKMRSFLDVVPGTS